MSNYFELQFEYGVDGYAHIETSETLDVHFFTGKRLKETFPPTTVSLRSRPKAPDCIGVGSLDLVSERLRDFLIEQNVNAEFLEVEVIQKGQRTDNRYYEMNVLDVFMCFDRERSVFEESVLESGYRRLFRIHQLYLDESKISNSRLFVMKEKVLVMIHKDLADELRATKFTGMIFRSLPQGPF